MGSFKPALPLIAALVGAGIIITVTMGLLHKRPVSDYDGPFGDV